VVVLLYVFLFEVTRVAWRGLSATSARAPSSVRRANLEIVNPAAAALRPGEVITLRTATTIGRERGNDVVVDEETVSGRHARLLERDGRWWIEDLGSTNGTRVNESEVRGSCALRPGDIIQVGRVRLRFSV
jgi:pSer/pThr/pTyr-binding forkhead associated (FHA) protein